MAAFLASVNPEGAFALEPEEINVGAILFGFFLCGSTTNLLLVPIPMLLGFFLFTRQLIRVPTAVLESPCASSDRQAVLGKLIALKDAQRLVRLYRDSAEKKYAEGSLSRDDYEKGIGIAEGRVAAARNALEIDEGDARRRTFSLGPGSGAGDNARRAMLYSVPLTIIFLLPQFDEAFRRSGGTFPIIEALSPLMRAATHWLVAAFLFGYFYHAIKGRDAVAKGVAFSIALILPALVVATLAGVSFEPIAKGTGCWLLHFFGVNVCTGSGGG